MLLAVTLQGFRSCADTTLDDIGQVVALIGRNGAGKTNILRGIQWAAHMATRRREPEVTSRAFQNDRTRVTLTFRLGSREFRYDVAEFLKAVSGKPQWTVTEVLQHKEDGAWKNFIYRDGKFVVIDYGADAVQRFAADPDTPVLSAATSFAPDCEFIGSFLSGIRYYPLNEQNIDGTMQEFRVIESSAFMEWDNAPPSIKFGGTDAEMRILYMHLYDQEKLEEFKALIGPQGLGLIRGIKIHNFSERELEYKNKKLPLFHWMVFSPMSSNNGWEVPFRHLSYGTRRVLDLVSILIFDESTVCLIEHPEEGIHSGLFRRMVGVLQEYARPAQLIVTTHSGDFFNRLALKDIRFVSAESNGTSISRLKGEKLAAAEAYIGDDTGSGGSLSDFLDVCGEEL